MRLSKITPLADRRATLGTALGRQRAAPHRCGAKNRCPKAQDLGFAAARPITSEGQGRHPRASSTGAGRSNRSAAGGLTWCLEAPVSRSRSGLPRREPPRGEHRIWCLPAPASRPGHPGPFEEEPPFSVHQRWCVPAELQGLEIQAPARRESSLSGWPEMVPLDPHFKTSAVRSPRRRPLAMDA